MDAIRSATLVPGQQLAWTARIGKVEVGYAADLILIDGDPLDDLSLLRRPSAVIANGIWLDRKTLDALLKQALRR
jgi:imidazolonepropionase-like amidohydrolase